MKRNGWIALGNLNIYLKRLEIKVPAHPIKHQNENWFTFSEKKHQIRQMTGSRDRDPQKNNSMEDLKLYPIRKVPLEKSVSPILANIS